MTDKDGNELRLTKSKVKGIAKDTSGKRITGDAVRQIMAIEQRRIEKIAEHARDIAESNDRKTIMEDDIRIVDKIMED